MAEAEKSRRMFWGCRALSRNHLARVRACYAGLAGTRCRSSRLFVVSPIVWREIVRPSSNKPISMHGVKVSIGGFLIGAICLTCFGPQRAYAQAAGLVAAYSFDEGAGTTVADRSGNGNTGRIVGALWTTVGKYGKALSFNGAGSYVDLGNPASLRLTGSMTWSAWINAAASPADDGEIIAKSDNGPGWQIKTSPDTGPHKFGVAVSASSGLHTQRYSTTVRALNTWYHVAGVYNASARTLDVYVNGVLDDGVLVGAVPAAQVNSSVNVNIGRRTGGYYFTASSMKCGSTAERSPSPKSRPT